MHPFFEKSYSNARDWLNQTLWTMDGSVITPFSLIRFILLICLVLWLSRMVLHTLNKVADKRRPPQRYMVYRLARLVYYIVIVVGLLIAISTIGVDFSHLILLAGALGIGVGIGLQNIFNNFFSGVILLFEDQLKLGDIVELEGGVKGEIQAINFRTVTLKTPEGTSIFVPNSSLISSRVTLNWTHHHPYRCLRVPFAIKQSENQDHALAAILQAAKEMPFTLIAKTKMTPAIYLIQLAGNRLLFELWVWVDDKEETQGPQVALSNYLHMIETLLKQHGVELA